MNQMIAQIESLPDLIRDQLKTLDDRIRNTFNHNNILSTKKILVTGCGDSYFAGNAVQLALKKWTGLSVDVESSLQAGRYELPYTLKNFPNNPMVFGVSVSGGVSRTNEAINIANEIGAKTVAITTNLSSDLAKASDMVIDSSVPEFADAPGVRSYQVSMMVLYLIGLHFAEVNGRLTMQEADSLRDEIFSSADVISATIENNKEKAFELAKALKSETNFHFIGHGPNLATAVFSAAKVVESAGRYAVGQDTEEWAHFEYFNNVTRDVPTFIISPGYRSHGLAANFVSQMNRIGRNVIAVTPEDDQQIAPNTKLHLPVVGKVREELTPFVYMIAGELFSAFLAETASQKFFRSDDEKYQIKGDHRKTALVSLKDLE
ncbi:MAG TPA: hypothetical protein DDX29_11945 [Clostridiales bacterium]|nr:hypothetical protein [Clostridiales bacterium]